MNKFFKKIFSSILCLAMLFSFLQLAPFNALALSIDIGENPTPKVDIAVSVPADYPGTFEEFKEELTQALIANGMNADDFRITDTAVKIDTTNLDGWYVYDHYYNQTAYNALNLSDKQKVKQPYRAADNSYMKAQGSGCPTPALIQDVFVNKKYHAKPESTGNLWPTNQHAYSWQENDKANMIFMGYGTNALSDYMVYPATSDSKRTIEFDLNPAAVNAHTLDGAGFLLNSAITDAGVLNGYAVYWHWNGSSLGGVEIRKVENYNAMTQGSVIPGASGIMVNKTTFTDGTKIPFKQGEVYRIKVVLEKNRVSVTVRTYSGTSLGDEKVIYNDYELPIKEANGNGFGPIVGYTSHGCAAMTVFRYGDLEMTYAATAFDALKNVQYAQTADQKYFINLAGSSNDPNIPDENKEAQNYTDGIKRMDENEIFYLSNVEDGKILTNTAEDKSHVGLGSENGIIATDTDYVTQMAEYIAKNFQNKTPFVHQNPVESAIPLASFYITNVTDPDNVSQLMTVHQKHLPDGFSVKANIFDKSKLGTAELGAGDQLVEWTLNIYDPDGTLVSTEVTTNTVTTADGKVQPVLKDFEITNQTKQGRYTFELVVKDSNNKKSDTFQTYLTVFLDDEEPEAKAENTTRNHAKVTLTDRGPGIADDGITFIEDGRGSGVAAYWLTTDETVEPTEDDWEYLSKPVHEYSFDVNIEEFAGPGNKLVVWYKDECGNIGTTLAYKPIKVEVQDPDGNPLDEYYIISDEPIVVLPDTGDLDIPPHEDEDYEFSGWVKPDGGDVTVGDTVPVDPDDDDPTIVIRPGYTDTKVKLTYNVNAADAWINNEGQTEENYMVPQNSDLLNKINNQKNDAYRPGYKFVEWTLDAAGTQKINTQVVSADTIVYAQWVKASYTLYFDANGGTPSNRPSARSQVLEYQSPVKTVADTYANGGTSEPTREGYIFGGWCLDKEGTQPLDDTVTMPASDYRLYAKWNVNTNKYIVHFDSNGGSAINDHSYLTADKNYKVIKTPVRPGYTFDGWYEKIVDADGNVTMGDTLAESEGAILPNYVSQTPLANREHTLIAKWTKNTDTKYSVAYYYNTGNKDADGNYIYAKAADLTKTYQGETEAAVTVPAEDVLETITAGASDYWYNADIAANTLNGNIAGNGSLELKLYYDRYFDFDVKIEGEGTAVNAMKQKEGTTPTVTYQAAEGYHISKVMLDGQLRDDLISQNSFTLADPIHENHLLLVQIEKDPEVDPDEPTPPVIDDSQYFTVKTRIEGCFDNKCSITPTTRVAKGSDLIVEWDMPFDHQVVDVLIDGQSVGATNNSTKITAISADHEVVVKVVNLPTVGGNETDGQYTVTVNRYGGDSSVVVTPTTVGDAGSTVTVRWDASKSDKYEIYKVVIDGVEVTNKVNINKANNAFRNLSANHVVDIYVKDKAVDDTPVYSEDEYNRLNTQIVGGPGTITGGGVVEKGSNQEVAWGINTVTDPTQNDYSYYEIESIEVNGTELTEEELNNAVTNGKINLDNLDKDTNVVVNIKPVIYNVKVYKYGNGTVSESKTFFKGQSYNALIGTPDSDHGIAKIVVDGVTVFDITGAPSTASLADETIDYTRKDAQKLDLNISSIADDHVVEVYFTPIPAGETDPEPVPDDVLENTYQITATVITAPTATIEGEGKVQAGADQTVSWNIPKGYEVTKVTVNGAEIAATGNTVDLTNINADQDVQIFVKKSAPNSEEVPVTPDKADRTYDVTTSIVGTGGVIRGEGKYLSTSNATVKWEVTDEDKYEVKYVIVNGKFVDLSTITDNTLSFDGTLDEYDVVVVIEDKDKLPPNVDVDGDGKPDINIDPDGDGKPDVNIDTDGDGEPDINIDTDGDGEPDKEIDEDGDLKVDTYVTVNYLDESGKVLSKQIVKRGNRGDSYTTEAVTLRDYDLTATPDNADGVMQDVNTTVNYIYTPKVATVKVEFVTEDGKELADSVILNGRVFDNYSVDAAAELQKVLASGKTYGYKLVSKNNDEGTMTVEQQVVTYTFALRDSVVVVRFVDQDGNEIPGVEKVTVTGKALNEYKTEPDNDIYGYTLDTSKLPDNATGIFTEEEIVVTYVYNLKDSKVIVNYVDENGDALADQETKNSKVFDKYTTEAKEFYGYELIATPSNAKGTYEEEDTVVTYSYRLKATTVIVNHVDENGKTVAPSTTLKGKVFDEFKTNHLDNIYGYKFVNVVVEDPEAAMLMRLAREADADAELKDYDGQMKESVIVVNYIYAVKDSFVNVKYVDENGNELADSDTINGKVFDKYNTNAKDIYAYELVSDSKNASGEMTEDGITVIYTYKQVLNIDKDGDGKPDINIDKDGDGKPDVNIDTDGDGEPDVNIDKDGDGEPDINIDTDKDGEPDINIDTDKDGEPDVNIDTDKDGEPDVNIDTDKDGEPDVNIDTDKDGKPDVNVDTDKDGKPDVNIDTDKDGKPDVNIDTDGDGKADINIDTDGDNKADINIDTTGDGKPNINIDTTGDGKADLNIDTDGDGIADTNVDTDGDGKADINIDTDGDGIADANLDTDGDGIADTNIIGAVDTGSNDMLRLVMFSAVAIFALFALILVSRRRKEGEAK